MALCPCHDDTNPSLQVWDTEDGPAFKCYAGCTDQNVRAALLNGGAQPTSSVAKVPTSEPAGSRAAKDPDHPDHLDTRVVERRVHVYQDEQGREVARVLGVKYVSGKKRFRQQRPDGKGGWVEGLNGYQPPLYRLPAVLEGVRNRQTVWVVEGEKLADRLSSLGFVATTNPMGAGKWRGHHTEALRGARVVVLPDNDKPGRLHASRVVEAVGSVAREVKLLELPNLPPKGDVLDWLDAGGTRERLLKLALRAKASTVEMDWQLPVPFTEPELPQFPTQVLPFWLRDWVEAEAEATQTPTDLPALVSLAVLATACQGKAFVQPWEGYREPLNLYVAVVLPSGARKSAVMADATRVLQEFEREEGDRLSTEVAQAESHLRSMEKRLRQVEDDAARDGTTPATDLAVQVAELRKNLPRVPRLLADDITPEKLVQLMAEQGGKIAVFSPEGGIFETLAGRYSGSTPNLDAFLKAHSGDPLRTDRLSRPGEHVQHPAMTLCLAIQPDVVRAFSTQPGFRGRGLTARFLYSHPVNLVGRRKVRTPAVAASVARTYERNVRSLLAYRAPGPEKTHLITLEPEAAQVLESFAAWLEPQLAPSGSLGFMADWGGKLTGAVVRVAALFHAALSVSHSAAPWAVPVEPSTVAAAVEVGRYLIPHAQSAHGEMGADRQLDDAQHLWAWIRGTGEAVLPKQVIWQGTRGWFKKAAALDTALSTLCERGYLRELPVQRRHARGRKPAPEFEVNPRAGE